jgi:hypothetical protein
VKPRFPLDVRRRPRFPASRLPAAAAGLALTAGLTLTAVSSAAASGTPGQAGGGQAVITDTSNPATLPGQAAASSGPAQTPSSQSTTVTLPTGDQVPVRAVGTSAQQATPIPARTAPGTPSTPSTYLRFTWGGDQYVIPDAAVPYLHSTLDPRLFDVSYLARLGTSGTTGIPVRITYTSAAAHPSLAGVRITHRSGLTATATITPAQAAGFGQLLAADDHHSPALAGRIPGVATITLSPPAGAPQLPASPAQTPSPASAAVKGLPFYKLTLNATDLDGNPGAFGGIVQNVGNAALLDQTTSVFSPATGSESLSVPKGTYSLAISVLTPDPSGTGFDTALVVKPQVTVDSDTTVSLDARTAVPYQADVSTAATIYQRIDVLQFWRTSVKGGGNGAIGGRLLGSRALPLGLVSITPNPGARLFADQLLATPTAPVTKGSFAFDANSYINTGSATAPGPIYALDFPYQAAIPSSLTYTVPAAGLTTVPEQVYAPSGCTPYLNTYTYLQIAPGLWERSSYDQTSVLTGSRSDYWYSGDPRLDQWQDELLIDCSDQFLSYFSPPQRIAPGQQISPVSDKMPAAPSPNAPLLYPASEPDTEGNFSTSDLQQAVCTACRQGDIGTVNILPFIGSDPTLNSEMPSLLGSEFDPSIEFYRDGTLAIDSADTGAAGGGEYPWELELPLLPQPASYQLDSTYTRPDNSAATIDTDWTFRSSPADPPAWLPPTEMCAPDATRGCSFLPLLFLGYDLPLTYSDQATAGTTEPVSFTVTSQQNAPAPWGVSATVSASFDGGQTWTTPQPATSLGGGEFTTTISQPSLASTNGFVSLRVTAADAFGDSVTQTLIDAYGLTS